MFLIVASPDAFGHDLFASDSSPQLPDGQCLFLGGNLGSTLLRADTLWGAGAVVRQAADNARRPALAFVDYSVSRVAKLYL